MAKEDDHVMHHNRRKEEGEDPDSTALIVHIRTKIEANEISMRSLMKREVPIYGEHLRRTDDYFDAAELVSTWPAISLRSFGYSTISIRRLVARPSSESFEARG